MQKRDLRHISRAERAELRESVCCAFKTVKSKTKLASEFGISWQLVHKWICGRNQGVGFGEKKTDRNRLRLSEGESRQLRSVIGQSLPERSFFWTLGTISEWIAHECNRHASPYLVKQLFAEWHIPNACDIDMFSASCKETEDLPLREFASKNNLPLFYIGVDSSLGVLYAISPHNHIRLVPRYCERGDMPIYLANTLRRIARKRMIIGFTHFKGLYFKVTRWRILPDIMMIGTRENRNGAIELFKPFENICNCGYRRIP